MRTCTNTFIATAMLIADVTAVTAASSPLIAVSITPNAAEVLSRHKQQFTASVTGTTIIGVAVSNADPIKSAQAIVRSKPEVADNFKRVSLGANWSTAFGATTIVSNAYASDKQDYPQDSAAVWNATSFASNHYAQTTLNLPDSSSFAGSLVRGSVNNGYLCYGGDQFLFLPKIVVGVETQPVSTNTYTFQSGDVMRLYGATIRVSSTES